LHHPLVCTIMAGAAEELERSLGPEDEADLVRRAMTGDREAAQELLVRHEVRVFRTCAHLLPRGHDVEAAVQETLLRALRGLPRFSGRGSFGGWVVSIAVNLCRDQLRRHRLVPFTPLEVADEDGGDPLAVLAAPDPDPERRAMAREAVARLRDRLIRLPERQREVFTLRFFVELPLEVIAEAIGVDIGTVKTHLYRSVRRVREAVEEARPRRRHT
jgi:RNA polymerase sigma factor (sigma-70 family)